MTAFLFLCNLAKRSLRATAHVFPVKAPHSQEYFKTNASILPLPGFPCWYISGAQSICRHWQQKKNQKYLVEESENDKMAARKGVRHSQNTWWIALRSAKKLPKLCFFTGKNKKCIYYSEKNLKKASCFTKFGESETISLKSTTYHCIIETTIVFDPQTREKAVENPLSSFVWRIMR